MYAKNNLPPGLFVVLVVAIMSLTPVAHAAPEPAPLSAGKPYTVRANDTLWDIAIRFNTTVAQLTAANPNVNPGALRPGQTLIIPDGASMPAPTASAVYTVRPDDTLWDIAANYGLTIADLLAANPGVDPRRLMVGQQLTIPGIAQEVLTVALAAPAAEPAPVAEAAAEPPPPTETADELPPAETAETTDAPPPPEEVAPAIDPLALEMLNRINEKRLAGGRPALTWNGQLAAAAQAHADDCARRNRGSHIGSDGARLAARLQRAGYAATWSGENWANAQNVERAMAIWWNEPPGADPHVQNIMAGRATEIGIGVARGAWGIYFIADFGSR